MVDGIEWMQYNLANPKQAAGGATYAGKLPSECTGTRTMSRGKFYQWGINVAWNSTGSLDDGTPSGSWNSSTGPDNWKTQPCPDGWRLPTNTEFQNLIDNCTVTYYNGGWTSSDYGYITLTLKTDSSKKLEFPAVGYRSSSSSSLGDAGKIGRYWSSVAYDSKYAHNLYFTSSMVNPQAYWDKQSAKSVRCVKGEVIPDIDPTQTVTMAGTEWMQVNLANPKQADGGATFATKLPSQLSGVRAESHGKFYQWGINVAWSTTTSSASGATPSGSWNTSTYPADWNTHPCPDGYRLPTNTEFQNLIDNCTRTNGGGWSSSDYGYITLTLKTDSSKKLEFPAVGYRNNGSSGTLSSAGVLGYYWSSVAYGSTNAYRLLFNSSNLYVDWYYKQSGFSVRCVKDMVVFDEVEMGDLKWTTHNLANPKQASGGATFATKLPSECSGTRADSHGRFYQWGINVAWYTTGSSASGATPSGSWNTSYYPTNWNTHPCPDGYRLPTNTEYQNLIDNCTRTNGGGWTSSDYGYITLTLKTDSSKKLEFPAVGWRGYDSSGTLGSAGVGGGYWSSVAIGSNDAYRLTFASSGLDVYYSSKQYG
ncbi:MAG: hypothetical protein K2N86_06330, partial [Rikenellaceae bacterium]|nr:hypothetical protein [Rikenellaceae bacterium]